MKFHSLPEGYNGMEGFLSVISNKGSLLETLNLDVSFRF